MKAQQGYIDSWASISEKMAGTLQQPKKPKNPWIEAIEQWETMVPGGGQSEPYMQRMLDQGKAFFEMSGEINQFLKLLNDVNSSAEEWKKNLQAQMEQMKFAFETGQGEMASFWTQPMEAFKDAWGNEGFNPQSLFDSTAWEGFSPKQGFEMFTQPMQQEWDKLIDAPGVGPDREAQESFKQNVRLWMNYQEALTNYNTALQRVGKETIERLTEKLMELSEKDEKIESMRAVYDLWVDCAEEAYADFAMSEEYQDVYAGLINSMMGIKQAYRDRVNKTAKAMGLPTQAGFDTVLKRMQEMRRELRSMKKQGTPTAGSAELSALKSEVNDLKAELADLKKALADLSAAKPAPAPRKKRAAKKTTAKSSTEN